MLKNAIAYAEICGIYAIICEFLHMRNMRHNIRICDFDNVTGLCAEKYAIGLYAGFGKICDRT